VDLFREFHNRSPLEVFEIDVTWSAKRTLVGEADFIVYRSDKWGAGTHDYIHHFITAPAVYRMIPAAELGGFVPEEVALLGGLVELQVLTKEGTMIDLGPKDAEGSPLDLPWLGAYEEEGEGRLIVLSSGDPAECYLITSKDLRIEARGIVG
jgi:hypothetical protein